MRDEELLSGIPRVVEMVKGYGLPEPEYIDMEIGIRVNFYRPSEEIRQEIRQAATQGITQVDGQVTDSGAVQVNTTDNQNVVDDSSNNTDKVTVQVTVQAAVHAAVQVDDLICSICNDVLSRKDIMYRLHLTHLGNFSESYLVPAIQQGYVTMLYPDKPRHPRQKYYLTEKGKELLKLIETKS